MKFEFECELAVPLETVFQFHENPANLVLLMRGWPGFRLLHHAGNVRTGSTTWVEQRCGGILPVVLGFRHAEFEPERRFTDELIHGPFSVLVHIHEFEKTDRGTRVRDRLDLRLPWHYGGERGVKGLCAPVLARLFEHRHRALRQWAEENRAAA